MQLDAEFALELGRVSRRWRARLDERLKHTGLTQARWYTLAQLSKMGPMPQHLLAQGIGVEGPTLVRILDGLEKQRLITRRTADDDRRVRHVHLTDEARPLLEEINRISTELRGELLSDVDQDDLATAWKVLRQVADRLERSPT